MIIPVDKLQAVIHLEGRVAALGELVKQINEDGLTEAHQISGAISNMSDEIGEMLKGMQYALEADLDNLTGEQ